jgi:hypothetical protein
MPPHRWAVRVQPALRPLRRGLSGSANLSRWGMLVTRLAAIRLLITMLQTIAPLIFGLVLASSPVTAQPAAPSALEDLRAKARERMERERETFSPEQLGNIESLYQSANRDLRAPSSKEALLKLVAMFPTANRAGCALLYLAQLSPPDEREAFLTRAIADHSDAWYGDGTQVGPFAKAQLAALYASTNRYAEAVRLAEEIEREYPESVDHSGSRLTDMLRRMKLLQEDSTRPVSQSSDATDTIPRSRQHRRGH